MIHDLKIQQEYLNNLLSGRKKVEIRVNDRDYQKGDTLRFPNSSSLIDAHLFEITHIHSGLGMEDSYVALSVKMMDE